MKFASALLILSIGSCGLAETLQKRADKIHGTRQEPSESVVLGKLMGTKTEFAAAGAIREGGPVPDQHTLYEIGSITKVFTAILLAETVRGGKAKFDDPVAKFLPVAVSSKDSPLRKITLESLATHTSGLPRIPVDLFEGADKTNPYAHYDEKRLYRYLKDFTEKDLEKPGKYSYSNLGFGLLGNVLERIWDKPYPDLVKGRIFEPLGMKHSLVPTDYDELPDSVREKLASGHNAGKEVPHWELAALLGAGAIVSSAHDLLLFAKGHWDDETPDGLAASLREAAKERGDGVGLGWMISNGKISHGGGTGGFRTNLSINVAEKTAEADLKNSAGESMDEERIGEFSSISGFWEGTIDTGSAKLRIVQYIGEDGRVISFSLDQGFGFYEATKVSFADGKLSLSFPTIGGFYEGNLKGDKIEGTWSQSGELPLTFRRADGMPADLKKGLAKFFPDDLTPLLGYWSGYLGGKDGLFVYFKIGKIADSFVAQLYSPDQVPTPIPVSRLELKDGKVKLKVAAVKGTFDGKWKAKSLKGTWNQGKEMPLNLKWSAEAPERK